MAKKKYEFKPDPAGSGTLSKLYLTHKQQRSLLKWLLYSLVCLVILVIQDVVLSGLDVFGATTDLVSGTILLICLLQGPENGGVFALICSMFYLFSGSAPGAYSIVFLTVYGILAAIFRQAFLRKSFGSMILCAAGALLLYELSVFAMGLFLGYTIGSRIGSFLITWLLTLIVMPVLYPILSSIGKIGGETWKE
ncbi:MAG: hypothetical protein IJX67_11170 [Oscillospiraceae bacterium]|nr:hypothetical protein [Oscillospiraceae bacterium]